jgi:succinoglycan biosynthesis protein ExoM
MGMPPEATRVCVCICTLRRTGLLLRLLQAIEKQRTEGLFQVSAVVVDNDCQESARAAVEGFQRSSPLPVQYRVEHEQNISLARNRAIATTDAQLVALIDDDEVPQADWLLALFQTLDQHDADGVLGPVLPAFDRNPPEWVTRGRFFERPSHASGEVLHWKNTRSGNALLRRSMFQPGRTWFDPVYGSGGEDRDLFRRLIDAGRVFRWCNEAVVHECVPPARWKRSVMLKRALLRGKMAANRARGDPRDICKSVIAVCAYSGFLPIAALLGQHVLMRYLIKDCDHLGKLLALCGLTPVMEKYV